MQLKIISLYIENYQQFKDFNINFCDANDQPLHRICLIGRNGTGKTTILKLLRDFVRCLDTTITGYNYADFANEYNFSFKIYFFALGEIWERWIFQSVDNSSWFERIYNKKLIRELDFHTETSYLFSEYLFTYFTHSDLTADFYQHKLPQTNLHEALKLNFEKNVQNVDISAKDESINSFWRLLIFKLQNRRNLFDKFLSQHEEKTVKEVRAEFDIKYPSILTGLADIWNKILSISGLYFDEKAVNSPATNNDNLEAFVKVKATGETLGYNELSTGIRDFMFKIGYLYTLYFEQENKEKNSNFLFMDEPENGLFADFLYNYLDDYLPFTKNNTQLFMATHSPIVASQFEPYEKRILDFDENHQLTVRNGIAPIGDDVNDVLKADFQTNVYNRHPKAKAAWDRYLQLLSLISANEDKAEKKKLVSEYLKLGQLYNFPATDNL